MPAESGRGPATVARGFLLGLLGLLILLAPGGPSRAAPSIAIVTMDPGADYWARFGHNAVLVDRGDGSEPVFYNFGYFDFDQPGFFTRFLRGDMRYRAVALPMSQDLAGYARDGRGARLQWLALEPGQAEVLAASLAEHVRPENAEYRYDYFENNCSTKVRDALDAALGGTLKRQLEGRSNGVSYRHEALRHGSGVAWLEQGMDLGLGPYADRPLSLWEQAFIPSQLAAALREARLADGRPLVMAERELLPSGGPLPPAEPRSHWLTALLLGVLLATLVAWAARSPRGGWLLALYWGGGGLIGLGLLALWLGTDHVSAWANRNLLLFNPLSLLLVPASLALGWRGRPARGGRIRFAAQALCVLSIAGLVLAHVQVYPQAQLTWIALMLPSQIALALALRRRRSPG